MLRLFYCFRFTQVKDQRAIQKYIQDLVTDQLNKRQVVDSVSRNFLRFLTSVCGYTEVRLRSSQKLETWLQNPKLTRPAQELLLAVCLNCNTNSTQDTLFLLVVNPASGLGVQCMIMLLLGR